MHIISAIINGDPINNYLIDRAAVESEIVNRNGGPVLLRWLEEIGGSHAINPTTNPGAARVLRDSSQQSDEVN